MVAAVFAVHPLHVESVAWVFERKDVLSGLFYLAAALAWMRFVEQPRRGRYAGALALYVAGLLSKSIVVTLPVALLIWHWWKQGRVTSTDLLRLVPFFIVGTVITVGDLSFSRSVAPVSLDFSLTERMLLAARALWFYAGNLLWPSSLAVIYPRWDIRVADPMAWGYLVAAVSLAMALWHFRSRLGHGPLAWALFFAVTLSPVLGFVDYTYMKLAFVADRYQYLAGIGVMAVVIGAAAYGARNLSGLWQKGTLGIAAVVLVVLRTLTWRQASIYRDDETFWQHVVILNPQARVAHVNLGAALYMQERYEEAETRLRSAIVLDPQSYDAYLNLSNALWKQERYVEALEAARAAVQQQPDLATVHTGLGVVLAALERYDEALKSFDQALSLDPTLKDVRTNREAVLEMMEGNVE